MTDEEVLMMAQIELEQERMKGFGIWAFETRGLDAEAQEALSPEEWLELVDIYMQSFGAMPVADLIPVRQDPPRAL